MMGGWVDGSKWKMFAGGGVVSLYVSSSSTRLPHSNLEVSSRNSVRK